MKELFKKPALYITIVVTGILGYLLFQILRLGILPLKFMIPIAVILVILLGIAIILMFKEGIVSKVIGYILAIVLSIGSIFGGYYLQTTHSTLNNISQTKEYVTKSINVYALKTLPHESVEDIKGKTVGILKTNQRDAVNEAIKSLEEKDITLTTKEYDSSIKMMQDFKGQAIDLVILDSAYISTIEDFEGFETIREEIKSIYEYEVKVEVEETAKQVDVTTKPFTILVTGIDTYGQLEETSRSDVNLMLTVNPVSKQMFLLSIPRDYYVETACSEGSGCAQGQMDKLTHTGIHGVDTTSKTLEKLLGVEINYFIRVNFTTFTSIIDELGGVTVNNPIAFLDFPQGQVELNGKSALTFVRERYSFEAGDRQRGKNQMLVLSAILQKMMSPELLKNYSGIMSSLENSFQTNMTPQEITSLVNMQLNDGAKWTISNYSVDGSGGKDFAYELGDIAYVMYPNMDTVKNAKLDIQAIEAGETPPYVNSAS